MPQVKIVARNFMDMVASLPTLKLDMLYDNSFICAAILRSLPPLAKKYVLQLLYLGMPISAKTMEEWVLPYGFSKHKVAIDRLIQLRVLTETLDRKREATYQLNPKFQFSLEKHIVHGLNIILATLFMTCNCRDQCFLLHLISSSEAGKTTNISSSMMKVFQRGLLSQRDDREPPRLTESGFQFLLMDTNAQLWYIIREYIINAEAYNRNTLTNLQRSIIKDLSDLGLVKLQEGFIIVETNFRPYAYSTLKLHCEILRPFARVEYQLPNLIVGAINKESLYKAFQNGITAEQIRLWESDLSPVEIMPAGLNEKFPSKNVFEAACDFAREYGGLMWEDSERMLLIVKPDISTEVKEFIDRQKQ
ncbi:unnamed protein product [Withania somnifera]